MKIPEDEISSNELDAVRCPICSEPLRTDGEMVACLTCEMVGSPNMWDVMMTVVADFKSLSAGVLEEKLNEGKSVVIQVSDEELGIDPPPEGEIN